jgi:hypothetical protein
MSEHYTEEVLASMGQQAALLAQLAHEDNAGALILHPYGGPPPSAAFFLTMMREMIDSSGEAMGCICIGIGPESGMLPLMDVHPVEALHQLVHLRLAGIIPSVDWVTLAFDTYVKISADHDAERGDATAAFQAGDPDAYEALAAMCVAPDGPGYDMQQKYTRTEDGITWEEPVAIEAVESAGDIPMLMRELVMA